MSLIYCITNDINGKQYVGKTEFSIEKRFKEHCSDSKRERCEKRPLYNAMNKYGIEHFHIEQLEECPYDEAEDREIYWIDKLDTFHNGYNATLGGDAKHYLDYDKILCMIDNTNKSLKEISKECNCSTDSVRNISKRYSRKINWSKRAYDSKAESIVMLNKDTGEEIMTFPSSNEAMRYIKSINKSKQSDYYIDSGKIRMCCKGIRNTAHGYKWKFVNGDGN